MTAIAAGDRNGAALAADRPPAGGAPAGAGARARLPVAGAGDDPSLMGVLLAFAVVGWEQLLHAGPGGLPLYQLLHWVSDSLIALPLALLAVWAGSRLATRRGFGRRQPLDLFVRASLIALLFALLLVPGGFLHDQIDALTRTRQVTSLHTHAGLAARDTRDPAVILAFLAHAFSDGLLGQVVGLPLVALVPAWLAHRQDAAAMRRAAPR
jgi:hypothetical protein